MTTTTPRMVTSVSFGYSTALDPVIEDTVAPHAAEVDRDGTFPRAAIDAIAKAGLLGLISSPEVGGHGLGMREAAQVVERLAASCGSTAMVVLMHYAATAVLEAHGPRTYAAAIAARRASEHPRVLRGRLAQPLLGAGEHRRRARRRVSAWTRARAG